VMFAIGRLKVAGVALTGSWLLVIAADLVLAGLAPPRLVVAALALGSTVGQVAMAIPLLIATRAIRGDAALHGVSHAAVAGLAAGAAGAAAGVAVSLALPLSGKLLATAMAVVAAACAVIAFGLVSYLLDRGDLRALTPRLAQIGRNIRGYGRSD
jgi:putative peptidoglycan lipid II flippase